LDAEGVAHRVMSRIKTPYGAYVKMRQDHKPLAEIVDLNGFRIIVGTVKDCYHALGIVHALYKPLDGRFKDFIAIPKTNGYQSLHTVLFGPTNGQPIEIQIRTEDMHGVAESGIAAHWAYKTGQGGSTSAQSRARDWLSTMAADQKTTPSSLEFIENVKIDLYPDEVYLFTPKGRILDLPRNATALDFAYAVHTRVGDRAVAARIDGRLVPLRTRLSSGQTVEITTAKSAAPNPHWLDWVVSGKARTAIRHYLKRLQHEDAIHFGHRMLDRALDSLGASLEIVRRPVLDDYLAEHRYKRLEDLLSDIALGNVMPDNAAHALLFAQGHPEAKHRISEKIQITGSERGVLSFANCCHPVPGDEIMGYLSTGKGIVVHRIECPNVPEFRKSPQRCVEIAWDRDVVGDFKIELRIGVGNHPGVLAQVASAIAQTGANIENVEYQERDLMTANLLFTIEVRNRQHLANVMRGVRRLGVVNSVHRHPI
ncbi:MAG: TGS domain-containing protein, partial [Dokdonella sp.]